MRQIEAYETSDGQIFTDEKKAASHQEDIIGEILDTLLQDDSRGNVTRNDRYSILTRTMAHPEFRQIVRKLYLAITHGAD